MVAGIITEGTIKAETGALGAVVNEAAAREEGKFIVEQRSAEALNVNLAIRGLPYCRPRQRAQFKGRRRERR